MRPANLGLVLAGIAGGTLWWYGLAAVDIWRRGFAFDMERGVEQCLAAYVVLSQVGVLVVFGRLAHARTLRAAQGWIIASTVLCIPADVLVIIQAPFGDIASVVVFYWVTVVFGIPMMLWLLRASEREGQPCDQPATHRSLATALAAYRLSK